MQWKYLDNSNYTLNLYPYLAGPLNKSSESIQDIPIFFFPNVTEMDLDDSPFIMTASDVCFEGYRTTWLRQNRWYIIFYVFWSKFILVELVPWVSVIVLTICTWRQIRKFQVNRDRLLANRRKSSRIEGDQGKIIIFYAI